MAKKIRTEEEKAARKAKNRDKKANKRQALVAILNYVRERKNVPDEVLSAVKLVTPGNRVVVGGTSRLATFAKLFTESASVTEAEIFEKFKAGRGEMRKVCVNLIKKSAPDKRIWVRFDVKSETYVVDGTGENPPKDWTGYRPVEVEEETIQ